MFCAFGYACLGPFTAGFVCWLLQLARQTGHTRLLFAEREGLFFRRLMDRLLAGTKVGDIETDTIAVSRKSVLPLIVDSNEIGIKIDAFERRLKLGIDAIHTDVTPEEISNAYAYFSKKLDVGSASNGKTLFVDIGYKGTINSYLNVYLKDVGVAPMAGAYLFHTGTSFREAYSSYGYLSEHSLPVNILSRSMKGVSFLEQCFMPDTGSVIGYDENASPVRDKALLSQRQLDEQDKVQTGIETFMDDLLEICGHLELDPSEALLSREITAEELLNLFQKPSIDVQDIALNWRHEINFGTKTVIPVSAASMLDLVGPCDEHLRKSKCWTGPLWNSRYFNPQQDKRKASVHFAATTCRGPIGPGVVHGTHPLDKPVLTAVLQAPVGEHIRTLRIAELKMPRALERCQVTIFIAPTDIQDDPASLLEVMSVDDGMERIEIDWQGSRVLLRDLKSSVNKVRLEKDELLVTFSEDAGHRSMVVRVATVAQ